jgi:beta-lactamase regulating signal transducer with metallopeptidase domain
MVEFLQPGTSLSWDLLWQSSLFLAVGLTAGLALRRHPARAHRVLFLAMIAALFTPLLSQSIRRGGWGLLRPAKPVADTMQSSAIANRDPLPPAVIPSVAHIPPPPAEFDAPGILILPRTNEAPASASVSSPHSLSISWRQVALGAWLLLSGLATLRLASSFIRGFRMLRGSVPCDDPRLLRAASEAIARLGLTIEPEVRISQYVRCPSVWCWSRRPTLLVPAGISDAERAVDWVAIFCHELAHWQRFDHVASLAGQIMICVLPWNPLASWTKRLLDEYAELACDDWVLASGMPGTDYAASLLELLPQHGSSPALAAVSSRRGLVGRMKHILGDHRSSPQIGRGWAIFAIAIATLAASALALAQAGSVSPGGEPAAMSLAPDDSPDKRTEGKNRVLDVRVNGPDGKPVANASVLWLGSSKPLLGLSALPRDSAERRRDRVEVLSRATTNEKGQAELSAELASRGEIPTQIIVRSPGFGIGTRMLLRKPTEAQVKITLAPEVPICGKLLTPAGQPAAGVRVFLGGFHNDATKPLDEIVSASAGVSEADDELPEYWPRRIKTDAEGRFTLGGVPPEVYASLSFWHPDFAVDEVTVSTVADGTVSPDLKAFEIVPVKPTFIHTLEPARPVQGRVTDKETGKPLAGMTVSMTPMRRHGGWPFPGKTDADGRFRISGHVADLMYYTNVYPRADSGYLPASDTHQGWPAGAKYLEINFALDKGRLISGRVIDRDTKQPIPGAAVMYQPGNKNPSNKNRYDLRNTVLTDRQGKFTITGLPGDGLLAVEVPDPDAIRTPIKGTTYGRIAYPHGSITVNIPRDGEPKPVEIAVRKGVTIEARVVDPAGAVVRDLIAFYPGISACLIDVWNQGQEFPDGIVRIRGADPEKSYRVLFVKPETKLGAIADLKYDGNHPEPIEVRLQPTVSVHGKVGGAMPQSCQVYASLVLAKDRRSLSDRELFDEDLVEFYANILGERHMSLMNEHPGSDGAFTIDTLIPGANYYVNAGATGGREAHVGVFDLKPGENRDLGTLVLKERKP